MSAAAARGEAPAPTMAGANPFSLRAALGLVVFGALVFVALLWMIGAGIAGGKINDGGAHAGSKGLAGYAGMARLLEMQGMDVQRSRSETTYDAPGLLVLTPPATADGEDINRAIREHRFAGPTLVILPKWNAVAVPASVQGSNAKEGWVVLNPPLPVRWRDDVTTLGKLDLQVGKAPGSDGIWRGFGRAGRLPEPGTVQTLSSGGILTLVKDRQGQALAGYLDDGGDHRLLDAASRANPGRLRGSRQHPVVIVAEPDLLNNYGLARKENALLALALVRAAMDGERLPVTFDLVLNGHGRSANLLTLAFTPPFLAATLCLLMAMLAVGWRAFLRFGPARKAERAIAFGKAALVANAAGLVRRTGRLHLIGGPYADRSRARLASALGLSRHGDARETEAAIDRALASRAPDAPPFSHTAARLRTARGPHDVLKAAQELHALERMLIR